MFEESMETPSLNLFRSLKGKWKLSKKITNFRDGNEVVIFNGTAVFEGEENSYKYFEDGKINGKHRVYQRYIYVYSPRLDKIEVYFSSGNLFHSLDIENNRSASGEHVCISDYYSVKYDFSGYPIFKIFYTVSGPEKHYVSCSTYSALG
jgi:Family of unknown function (DUF6314)